MLLARHEVKIHSFLTEVLLCGKTCLTSKGKSMAPGKKLEKQLKKAIRDFRLAIDIRNFSMDDTPHEDSSKVGNEAIEFESWFKTTIVNPYVDRIP